MDLKESRRSTLAAPQRAGALESTAKKQKKRKKQKDTFYAVREGYFMRCRIAMQRSIIFARSLFHSVFFMPLS